jgi:hypothetical protein
MDAHFPCCAHWWFHRPVNYLHHKKIQGCRLELAAGSKYAGFNGLWYSCFHTHLPRGSLITESLKLKAKRLKLKVFCTELSAFSFRLFALFGFHRFFGRFFIFISATKQKSPGFKALDTVENYLHNGNSRYRQEHARQPPNHFAKNNP